MKKYYMIMGTLLTTTILLTGGVNALDIDNVNDYNNCTDPNNIVGTNSNVATVGVDPSTLGDFILDWGAGNGLGSSTRFVIVAGSSVSEDYDVSVGSQPAIEYMIYVGSGSDTDNEEFYTPIYGSDYRYVWIQATSGVGGGGGDHAYGPDLMYLSA